MSHYTGYVVSVGKRIREPWLPDEDKYNEEVGCDYCRMFVGDDERTAKSFVDSLPLMDDEKARVKVTMLKDGTPKIVLPKGIVKPSVEWAVKRLKFLAGELDELDVSGLSGPAYSIWKMLTPIDPFDQVVVELFENDEESFKNLGYWFRRLMIENAAKPTVVYIYGYIDHHA